MIWENQDLEIFAMMLDPGEIPENAWENAQQGSLIERIQLCVKEDRIGDMKEILSYVSEDVIVLGRECECLVDY